MVGRRLLLADAYEWVNDRAELLKKKNPDMEPDMAFGIAWKQWKKKHPTWKSKKMKEQEKKKKKKTNVKEKIASIAEENRRCIYCGSQMTIEHDDFDNIGEVVYWWCDDCQTYEKIVTSRLVKKAQYIHCHNCGWDNGDFLRDDDDNLLGWAENLTEKRFKKIDDAQIYKNLKEFREKNPKGKCPKCGTHDLDID